MHDSEKIAHIHYVFRGSALFEDDPKLYDVDASTKKYAELCRGALEQAYPDAEIEVVDADVGGTLQTRVLVLVEGDDTLEFREGQVVSKEKAELSKTTGFSWNSLEPWEAEAEAVDYKAPEPSMRECSDEVMAVESVCNEVYNRCKWEVHRPWLNTIEAHRRFNIPIAVIQWACREGLIGEAEEIGGLWKFPLERFRESEIRKSNMLADCKGVLGISITDDDSCLLGCYSEDVLAVSILDFPDEVDALVIAPNFFGISLFGDGNSGVFVTRQSTQIVVAFERLRDESSWASQWSYDTYAKAIRQQIERYEAVECRCEGRTRIGSLHLEFTYSISQFEALCEILTQVGKTLAHIIQDTELSLSGGPTWKRIYEENEDLFCTEVLEPLLRKLGYSFVRYTGRKKREEYGRDFTFSKRIEFGEFQHYGLQAKRGDMSGKVNSQIDEILGQLDDAFKIPYREPGSMEERYISVFIIAISGQFTENAQQKIRHKMPKWAIGSVYFWDKAKILSLIAQCWEKD
jgi:hypothetical protein